MAVLLSALSKRGRAVDDTQLELLLLRVLQLSQERVEQAVLAANQAINFAGSGPAVGRSGHPPGHGSARGGPGAGEAGAEDGVVREVLLLLQGLAAVRARPGPRWVQAVADLLGFKMRAGQASQVGGKREARAHHMCAPSKAVAGGVSSWKLQAGQGSGVCCVAGHHWPCLAQPTRVTGAPSTLLSVPSTPSSPEWALLARYLNPIKALAYVRSLHCWLCQIVCVRYFSPCLLLE